MGLVLVLLAAPGAAAAEGTTLYGPAEAMGAGSAQTYVTVDAGGLPTAIGIRMDKGALTGLPAGKNAYSRCFDLDKNGKINGPDECEGDREWALGLPAQAAAKGGVPFRWVGLNYNAEGHPPKPWSVPHFDFHFYIASPGEVAAIRVGGCNFFIDCDDLKTAIRDVPAKYVAPDHINVKAAVSRMGNHLIDKRTPELGTPPKPFSHTWIYGAYDGRITFYEPMITLEFLWGQLDICVPFRQPRAWAQAGWYPTTYCIRHHDKDGATTVSLEKMIYRAAE